MISGVLGNWFSKSKGFGVLRKEVKTSRYRLVPLYDGKTISNKFSKTRISLYSLAAAIYHAEGIS